MDSSLKSVFPDRYPWMSFFSRRSMSSHRPYTEASWRSIFIADFISEDRDFEGVEKLRELAYIDLNKTVLEGLKFTIDVLILKNQQIHEDTIFAYNELVKNRKGE